MTAENYVAQLQALLPPGAAWTREADATFTRLLQSLADELARVDARADDLLREVLPGSTVETLPEWERMAGLPERCVPADQTFAERRAALVSKVTQTGGQSPQYYIDIAAALGYPITITEFAPDTFAWRVNAPRTTVRQRRSGEPLGELYSVFGNAALECLIELLKPAHTTVSFAYAS